MDLDAFKQHVHGFAQSNILTIDQLKLNFLLGLAGEVGEFIDLYKKHLFHGDDLDLKKVKLETGDILWYLYAVGGVFGLSFEMAGGRPREFYYENKNEKFGNAGIVSELFVLHNYVAEMVSTLSGVVWSPSRPYSLSDYISHDITFTLGRIIYPITLQECMQANFDKLTQRHGGASFNRETMRVNKALEVE